MRRPEYLLCHGRALEHNRVHHVRLGRVLDLKREGEKTKTNLYQTLEGKAVCAGAFYFTA